MRKTLLISLVLCIAMLSSGAVVAQNNDKKKAAPAKPVVRQPVGRPPMMVRPQQVQRPGQANVQSGLNNPAIRSNKGMEVGAGVQQTPRSQLYQMVKPVGPVAAPHALATATAIRPGPVPAVKPGITKTSFARPPHFAHNPAHRIGSAGARFNHRMFAFRRDGLLFHRNYYIVGGVWYWSDAPFVETDPDYTLVDDGTLPVCDPDADECQ